MDFKNNGLIFVSLKEFTMEDKKYYTPELEEFHVGFEYESRDWSPVENWRINIVSEDHNIETLSQHLHYTRVKHLDKEDIEECGFKQIAICEYESLKTYLGLGTGDDKKLIILYTKVSHEILIYWRMNRGDEDVIFDGIIKNKSELKRILKMLCIDK